MKKIAILFTALIIISCSKQDEQTPDVDAQNISILIEPVQTDGNYVSDEKNTMLLETIKHI